MRELWITKFNGSDLIAEMDSDKAIAFTEKWIEMQHKAGPTSWTTYDYPHATGDLGDGAKAGYWPVPPPMTKVILPGVGLPARTTPPGTGCTYCGKARANPDSASPARSTGSLYILVTLQFSPPSSCGTALSTASGTDL